MAKKNRKKRKRRVSPEELRQTISPTKDFDFVNPHDEDDIIVVTAQRLSPGHLLEMDSSSLIKASQQALSEVKTGKTDAEETDVDKLQTNILENFDVIIKNVKYASEIASISIVDPKTGKNLYTKEECMLYFLPEWNTQIANWALAGARPNEGEDADDVDRFSTEPEQQEEPVLETEE